MSPLLVQKLLFRRFPTSFRPYSLKLSVWITMDQENILLSPSSIGDRIIVTSRALAATLAQWPCLIRRFKYWCHNWRLSFKMKIVKRGRKTAPILIFWMKCTKCCRLHRGFNKWVFGSCDHCLSILVRCKRLIVNHFKCETHQRQGRLDFNPKRCAI